MAAWTGGKHFNSQPHKEADVMAGCNSYSMQDFNSQPHKEADTHLFMSCRVWTYFNSQPHKEADDVTIEAYRGTLAFQLTASQGG